VYLLLLVFAAVDFLLARGMGVKERGDGARRALLGVSLLMNLGALAGLKLLAARLSAGGDGGARWGFLLALSLSFYVFQSLSYTIDVYRGELKPTNDLLVYLASALFFPSIVAGPIPRQGKLIREIGGPFRLPPGVAARALLLIATGLVKKLLIADYLADNFVDRVFDTPTLYSGLENLLGVYGYALQLFFDFSGYTDMAMGVGLLLGVALPENFRRPYLSVNLQDFWKRWHISFSSWLTDYLFESLPKSRTWLRLSYCAGFLVTFLLGGLWHGFAWTFVIWGLLHGIGLSIVFIWARWRGERDKAAGRRRREASWWGAALGVFVTFHFVCLAWVFFRAGSVPDAMAVLKQIGTTFTAQGHGVDNLTWGLGGVMLAAVVLHCIPAEWFDWSAARAAQMPAWAQGAALAGLILGIQALAGKGSAPFVYGKF
jgi:alginate O-acetyltransferase complex protein AlgI